MRRAALSLAFALAIAGGASCSLITSVDRSLIGSGGSGGGGGAGGETTTTTSSTNGGGGTGGTGGAECSTAVDCPMADTECVVVACEGGQCTQSPVAAGAPTSGQTAGDCKVIQCDGNGATETVDDDSDTSDDSNDCTGDVCTDGVPSNPNLAAGTPCGTGTLVCNGAGSCVGCTTPDECGADSECQHPTCTASVCGVDNEEQGTPVTGQAPGDCKVEQCDGDGAVETVNDDADVPVDGTVCTTDVCTAGVPSNPFVAATTPCSEGSGTLCNDYGTCVECLSPNDCPGVDDECQQRTCSGAGVCGISFTTPGTAVSSQSAGDCLENQCDGFGGVMSADLDTDTPDDSNPCTVDSCVSGTPTFNPAAAGTACGAGLMCDATGQCIGCGAAGDCPGSDDACKTRTCTLTVCGFAYQPSGTAVPSQTPGDCKVDVCDGVGNVVSQDDNADVPADDGNQCTGEGCASGAPTHPPLATNTPCSQNGGTVCNANGTCVACNAPAQCGTDTDCLTNTCNSNTCGVTYTAAGTVVTAQITGDCKVDKCNGTGGVTSENDDLDLPNDDGNQCTDEVCASGVASHPAEPANTVCNQNGGAVCDGATACVQCNLGSQCPSGVCDLASHLCLAATCSDGVKNGSETDVDCGGSCPNPCGPSKGCAVHTDCSGGACHPTTKLCTPTCTDASAPNATCTSYCTCMMSTCPTKFATTAACLDSCAVLDEAGVCCRAYHCGAAMGDPVLHCPHAAGEAVCP